MTAAPDPSPLLAAKLSPPRLRAPSVRADQLEQVAGARHVRLLLVQAPAGVRQTDPRRRRGDGPRLAKRLVPARRSGRSAARPPALTRARRAPAGARLRRTSPQGAQRARTDIPRGVGGRVCARVPGDGSRGPLRPRRLRGARRAVVARCALRRSSHAPAADSPPRDPRRPRDLASRSPSWRSTAISPISHADLRFDADQVAAVVRWQSSIAPTSATIERLLHLTEGWPAGVVLASNVLRQADPGTAGDALAGREFEARALPVLPGGGLRSAERRAADVPQGELLSSKRWTPSSPRR